MMHALEGRRVEQLRIEQGDERLIFVTDQGPIAYETDGDCCSETWFADITGVDCLLGHVVTKIEDVEYANYDGADGIRPPEEDGRSRQEVDQYYGVKLTTDLGYVDIVYRNSSNGYYGGDCEQTDRVGLEDTAEITSDWQAGAKVYE